MRLKVLIFIVVLFLCIQASAETAYVDPDVAGGDGNGGSWANAYSSLNLWEAGEANDLTSKAESDTALCRSSSGTDDTTAVDINGWTTSSTYDITIQANDFPTDGIYDNTKYVLNNNDAVDIMLQVTEEYVNLRKLQFLLNTTSGNRYSVNLTVGTPTKFVIDSCIFQGQCSGNGLGLGIAINDPQSVVWIYNTTVRDIVSGNDPQFRGINIADCVSCYIYNCVVWNCRTGINDSDADTVTKNTAVGNCNDDFAAIGTIDYCMSNDDDGTNNVDILSEDWDYEFADANNGDFTIQSGGNMVGGGTDNPGSGEYSDDIIDNSRASTWDIGAYEYQGGAAPTPQVIIIQSAIPFILIGLIVCAFFVRDKR